MLDNVDISIVQEHFSSTSLIYITRNNHGEYLAINGKWKDVRPTYEVRPKDIIRIPSSSLKKIADELGAMGIFAKEHETSKGKLNLMNDHLQDMRKLVFKGDNDGR